MKKKGFTLIELLAVIVILAIIAVITVPKIADMISSSRQGGAEDSFYGTLKAAELGYAKALQSNTELKGSTCTIADSKITCTNGVKIDVSGKIPESGVVAISSDLVSGANITLNGYRCSGNLDFVTCIKDEKRVSADDLKNKITASGDGLYVDNYEKNRFIYRGINPNNYVKFNNELWRIISIENNNSIKIMKDESLGKMAFDTGGNRSSSANTFCPGGEYGCGVFSKTDEVVSIIGKTGTVTEDSSIKKYLNEDYYNSLSTDIKNKIQKTKFYYGPSYEKKNINLNQSIKYEKRYYTETYVGLIQATDYVKASLSKECNSIYSAIFDKKVPCGNNYLNKKTNYHTLNIHPNNNILTRVVNYGALNGNSARVLHDIFPVVYLNKEVIIASGTGTKDNPYVLK